MLQFKNAWKCKKCPETANQPNGCPMWWEMVLTNDVTGEKKIEKGCGFQLLPHLISMTVSESMHTTAAAYDMRNKVVKNMGKVFAAVQEKLRLPEDIIEDEMVLIEKTEKKE